MGLEKIELDSDYPDNAVCYFCACKLTKADHKNKKKFGYKGKTKEGKTAYICWDCF